MQNKISDLCKHWRHSSAFTNSVIMSVPLSSQEAEMLRSISFHPSGDFLLVGTQHPTLRLYDVNTFQCFVSCNPLDQHTDTISGVSYNPSANSYVTCSKDGSIKLWDGVSNRCVTTFEKAHDGAEVCSAIFSKNSKYILSSGKDSVVKLWEISTGRTLVKYTGEDAAPLLCSVVTTQHTATMNTASVYISSIFLIHYIITFFSLFSYMKRVSVN